MLNIAIVTLTRQGLILANKIIKDNLSFKVFGQKKFKGDHIEINKKFKEFVKDIFTEFDGIIFIMATGIVVRVIAPYIKSKDVDPAIIVIDDQGNNVISLLSGHLGGANKLTKKIATNLNANPVITTASDVNNLMAVDTLAQKYNFKIDSLNDAKDVTALIVDKKDVSIISDYKYNFPKLFKSYDENESYDGIIYITNKKKIKNKLKLPSSKLIVPNIILGIGCRKGKSKKEIKIFLEEILDKNNIDIKAINSIASVELKKEEKGIIDLSNELNIPFKTFNIKQLLEVEDKFKISEFVKKTIGVGAVCEPSGYLKSNGGKCIQKKIAKDGITISLWEEIYE